MEVRRHGSQEGDVDVLYKEKCGNIGRAAKSYKKLKAMGLYFVGEGRLPGTDPDDGDVVEAARVGDGGRGEVAFHRMGHDDGVHLLGNEVVAPNTITKLLFLKKQVPFPVELWCCVTFSRPSEWDSDPVA